MSKEVNNFDGVIDKGLEGVPVCSTSISAIHNSTLFLKGYNLEDLVQNSSYSELVYLLWEGKLPNQSEWKKWELKFYQGMELTDQEKELLSHLPVKNVHPMAWLRTAVSSLSLLEKEDISYEDPSSLKSVGLKILTKTALLVSYFHCLRAGKKFVEPKKDKNLSWNFLYTLTGKEPDEESVKMFDICLILHADHSLNCSTFSARVTTSSLSDIYSALVSAIGTLKGPLHGGANEQVMKMLSEFSSVEEAEKFVDKAFQTKQKIMGFGHRVYKDKDPRAEILKVFSKQLTEKAGKENLYLMSEAMERKIRGEKGLCPNVDFYSASVYHCLGLPTDLFTPVFAVSRVSGWLAHIFEQYSKNRIYRPRSQWLGSYDKKWESLDKRS